VVTMESLAVRKHELIEELERNGTYYLSQEDELLPAYGYALCALVLFVIWLVGTFGNFLVIYLVIKNRQVSYFFIPVAVWLRDECRGEIGLRSTVLCFGNVS